MEVLVGMFLLLLLLSVLVMVFQTGANAWSKADAETELLQTLQVLVTRVERDGERSAYDSLQLLPGMAVSFLSPQEPDGTLALDPLKRRPKWRAYVIYYYDPALKAVLRKEVPLAPGSPEESEAAPIESYGTGQPLSDYLYGGDYAGWRISRFEPSVPVDSELLHIDIEAGRERYGRSAPETATLSTTIHFRN